MLSSRLSHHHDLIKLRYGKPKENTTFLFHLNLSLGFWANCQESTPPCGSIA
nr:MAG TPA: amylase [Caudoviricetes sp.]